MKLSPNLRNKLSLEAMLGDALNEDKNPEWRDILERFARFMDKMEELSEMQMKGADIFMTSFANLENFVFSELYQLVRSFTPIILI